MPIIRLAGSSGLFEPDELSLLQDTFDQICARGGIDRKSEQAEVVAADLIVRYRGGLRGEELFRAVLANRTPPAASPDGTSRT